MKKNNISFLSTMGIKRKMRIAFSLMSIIPLLMLLNYLFPDSALRLANSILIFLITLVLVCFGLFIIKHIFDSVSKVSSGARVIAGGDYSHQIEVSEEDEVGALSNALNQLTGQIRKNMEELRDYELKSRNVNIEINKRMLILSSLLQISSHISKGAELEDVAGLVVEQARGLANSSTCFILLKDDQGRFILKNHDGDSPGIEEGKEIELGKSPLAKLLKSKSPLIVDSNNKIPAKEQGYLRDTLGIDNCVFAPIHSRGIIHGFICLGNNEKSALYTDDDKHTLDLFAKQVAIALENKRLSQRVNQLEIKDVLTGLFNEKFIRERLQEEIKRALLYQRPCGFLLFEIDNFSKLRQKFGAPAVEKALKKISTLFKDSISGIDKAARFSDNQFAIVLPEKNKRNSQETAEYIRKKIESTFAEEPDANKKITVSCGISENPIDGTSARELIDKALQALAKAKDKGGNRCLFAE